MEGRSVEFNKPTSETSDKGFSEKRSARIIEGKQADNSQVKKRKPLISVKRKVAAVRLRDLPKRKILKRAARTEKSLKEKILEAHKKNAEEIQRLMHNFALISQTSPEAAGELMTEMRARQQLQEELLQALALEGRGELTEETLSKELVDLIK